MFHEDNFWNQIVIFIITEFTKTINWVRASSFYSKLTFSSNTCTISVQLLSSTSLPFNGLTRTATFGNEKKTSISWLNVGRSVVGEIQVLFHFHIAAMRKWKIVKLMLFLIDNCHTMLGLKRFHLYAHVYLPSSFECYPSLFLWLTWWLLNLLSRYLLWILRNDYGLQTKRSRANTISNLHCRHLRIRILARQIHEHLSYFVNLLHFGSGRSEQTQI